MKAWYGERRATPENDWCFDYLPAAHRRSFAHDHRRRHGRWQGEGLFRHGRESRGRLDEWRRCSAKGLRKLDWLVVRDFQLTETADFWREAPEIQRGEIRPKTSRRRFSSSPPPRIPRRTAASPIRSACCSGTTRRSNRRAIAAASSISSSTGPAVEEAVRGIDAIRRTGRSRT